MKRNRSKKVENFFKSFEEIENAWFLQYDNHAIPRHRMLPLRKFAPRLDSWLIDELEHSKIQEIKPIDFFSAVDMLDGEKYPDVFMQQGVAKTTGGEQLIQVICDHCQPFFIRIFEWFMDEPSEQYYKII